MTLSLGEDMARKGIIPKRKKTPKKRTAAQKKIATVVREFKRGTLKSGRGKKKVTKPAQALAIGFSQARERGLKVPKKRTWKRRLSSK